MSTHSAPLTPQEHESVPMGWTGVAGDVWPGSSIHSRSLNGINKQRFVFPWVRTHSHRHTERRRKIYL